HEEVRVTTQTVTSGPIARTIVTSGTLQTKTTVDVGTQGSGTGKSLAADYNSLVSAGQIIAQLDPSTYQAALDSARAELARADANVGGLRAAVSDARNQFDRSQALFQ